MSGMNLGAFKIPKTPRQKRLSADLLEMKQLQKDSSIFTFDTDGSENPDKYTLHFNGNSLVSVGDDIAIGNHQEVGISMSMEYPRSQPTVTWKTEIVHPNIFNRSVCFGNFAGRWSPYFHLVDLIEILWDYARLSTLNPASAYAGGQNARVEWEELDKRFNFPVDRRPLRNLLMKNNEGSSAVRPVGAADDIVIIPDDEGSCGK